MIKLTIGLEDWDGGGDKVVIVPCDLSTELDRQREYAIIDSMPHIPGVEAFDIWELNTILDEINAENPDMTGDLLSQIMEAIGVDDLDDKEFIRRIKENDFLFEDIGDLGWCMESEEIAARYIATILEVPFDPEVTDDMLEVLGEDVLNDYIDWGSIWGLYECMGFGLIECDDDALYLIHWR